MDHKIIGTTMPALEIQLGSGETIIADSGELSWMTDSIQMHTTTSGAGGKGIFGAIKRAVGGGTLFLTEYTASGGPGSVTFATKMLGMILDTRIEPGSGFTRAPPWLPGRHSRDPADSHRAEARRGHFRWRGLHPAEIGG